MTSRARTASDRSRREDQAGPLSWLRVVDVTDIRGAMCGRILADLGADVVKVETPGTPVDLMNSTAYRYRNASKRGVVAELDELGALLDGADALIENLSPGDRAAAGLATDSVSAAHPHLVHVALSDFGLSGPRAEWRLEPLPAQAAGGTLHASGFPDLPPCWLPGFLAHDCASVYGAVGAVAAVMDRRRHGHGQLVEVSVQEAALAGTTPWSVAMRDYLTVNPLLPAAGTRNADGSYWVFPAADGWVRCVIGTAGQWAGFCALLGHPEAFSSPEWGDPRFRVANVDVIRLVAAPALTDRTRAQLFEEALGLGTTVGMLLTPSEFVAHPQMQHRGSFVATGFPGLDDAPFAVPPLRFDGQPALPTRPAPAPGEHDGIRWTPRGDAAPAGGDGLLLDGVRVVEFGVAAVGPEVCGVLSELGADVIKVESTAHLDVLRLAAGERVNCSFAFNAEARGRRSVALDLSTPEGRELTFGLCAAADVIVENHRGGVLDKLGLGYEHVRAVNPRVVYASSQGYGRGGPYGEMPAYGPLNNGFAGLHLLWNHPDAPYPCGTSLNHPDHIAGKLLAVAVLAALDERTRTGVGRFVEMAQCEAAAYLAGEIYLDAALNGQDPAAQGNRHPSAVPHGVYPSAGDDRWIAVAVSDDDTWKRFVAAVDWDAPAEWATAEGRVAARRAVDARVAEWTAARPAENAAAHLQDHGVSAMPVMGPLDHLADPHLAGRGFIVELEHPEVGGEHHVGNPVRLSRLAQRTATSAPCYGAHTAEVLTTVLGLAPDRVAGLHDGGVCR